MSEIPEGCASAGKMKNCRNNLGPQGFCCIFTDTSKKSIIGKRRIYVEAKEINPSAKRNTGWRIGCQMSWKYIM